MTDDLNTSPEAIAFASHDLRTRGVAYRSDQVIADMIESLGADRAHLRADCDGLVEALRKARETLGKIHVYHRSHITIGPFATEPYAHIKMTCDHWPVVDELEASINMARGHIDAAIAKVATP